MGSNMMPAGWSRGRPVLVPVLVPVLALLCGCIDLANLRAVPDGGIPSGTGGAPSLGSGGAPFVGPTGTGGAAGIAGSGGATTPRPGTLSVEVRDLDADGTNEVILVDNTTGLATMFEAEPGQPVREPLPGRFAGRVVFGDFDGDGSTDLAFLSAPSPLAVGAPVQVLVTLNGRLAGLFAPPVVYDMVGMPADLAQPLLAALDVDGDGGLDLQVFGNGVTDLLMNDGHGAFRIVVPTPAVGADVAHGPVANCPGCAIVNPAARAVP